MGMSNRQMEGQPVERLPLREWRRRRLMEQADLARATGVSVNTISRWERGAEPRVKQLRKLCEVLGVAPEAIIFGQDDDAGDHDDAAA